MVGFDLGTSRQLLPLTPGMAVGWSVVIGRLGIDVQGALRGIDRHHVESLHDGVNIAPFASGR